MGAVGSCNMKRKKKKNERNIFFGSLVATEIARYFWPHFRSLEDFDYIYN